MKTRAVALSNDDVDLICLALKVVIGDDEGAFRDRPGVWRDRAAELTTLLKSADLVDLTWNGARLPSPAAVPARVEEGRLPYANQAAPDAVTCPVCGERVKLTKRKDWESYSGVEYEMHYRREHGASSHVAALDAATTTEQLTAVLRAWCADNECDHISADILVMDDSLTQEQVAWLREFITKWDDTEAAERPTVAWATHRDGGRCTPDDPGAMRPEDR